MKKTTFLTILVGTVIIGMILFYYTENKNAIKERCCQECLTAFSQSPVGVGPRAAQCGSFTTGSPLSATCEDYFSSSPRTVAECEK